MTRFELASCLSRGLNLLEESEKHNVINMYISDINQRIEQGEKEADAIAALGDIDVLINNILNSYGISVAQREEANIPEEEKTDNFSDKQTDGFRQESVHITEESTKEKCINKFYEIKNKIIPDKEHKEKEFEDMNKRKAKPQEKPAHKKGFFASLWEMGVNFTFTVTNLFIFIFIWMPCMAITAAGVIATSFCTVMYIFSGIGFIGICIAGAGCCIVGISFCIWLGNAINRGRKYE